LFMVSKKSDVADAGSGRLRVSFTKSNGTKMVWRCGARNVQIKLPTNAVGGGRLCENNMTHFNTSSPF